MTGAPIVGEIVGGGLEEDDVGVAGKIGTSQIAGVIGVVDGEDLHLSTAGGLEGEGGEVRWVQRLGKARWLEALPRVQERGRPYSGRIVLEDPCGLLL